MSESRVLTFAACSVGYWAPQGPTFHWRDGWMFARGEGGDVHIWHVADTGPPDVNLRIPRGEWLSILEAVDPLNTRLLPPGTSQIA